MTSAFKKRSFSKKNKKGKVIKMQVDDPGGQVSLAARKKTKNSTESRRTGEDEEAKVGGPTSKAARKTTL